MNNIALGGLFALAAFAVIALVTHESATATTNSCETDQVCLLQIIQQNERIEKKIDWNNCATSHIETHNYWYENGGMNLDKAKDMNANSYKELVRLCGELPK